MRGLALMLGVSLWAAACGGRAQQGRGTSAEAGAGPGAGSAGNAGAAGGSGLQPPPSCLALPPEASEPPLRAAVLAKLGVELPAGVVDASEPNGIVRGQQLVDAVTEALEARPLPAGSRRALRELVGELIGEGTLALPSALPADEQDSLAREVDRFAEHWAVEQGGSLEWLLTGSLPGAAGGPPEQRAGVMTLGALLARVPSPPQRALYLTEALACIALPPPPPVMESIWAQEPKQPAKNIVLQTYGDKESVSCAVCHTLYIGYAIALDRYDELGHYRESLGGLPIDTGYSLTMPRFEPMPAAIDGLLTTFANPSELGNALSQSNGVRACLMTRLNERLGGAELTKEEQSCLLGAWEPATSSFVELLALLAPRIASSP